MTMDSIDQYFGKVVGITGPMSSGKTYELIGRIKELQVFESDDDYRVVLVKPKLDNRILSTSDYDPTKIIESRNGSRLDGVIPIENTDNLFRLYAEGLKRSPRLVLSISEINFLDDKVIGFLDQVRLDMDISPRVALIWEGLTESFRGEHFPLRGYGATMGDVVERTDDLVVKMAFCDKLVNGRLCKEKAYYTQRIKPDGQPDHWSSELLVVGEHQYHARCAAHHEVPGKEESKYLLFPIQNSGTHGIHMDDLRMAGYISGIQDQEIVQIVDAFRREKIVSMGSDLILRYLR
jgi:thymidine kinase